MDWYAVLSGIIGALIGSLSSLAGVFSTNRGNNKRLREQLEYDRRIKREERELTLRKEVYLANAEAISSGLDAIYRFADLEIPNDAVAELFIQRSSSIGKSYLIANDETLRAIMNFIGELNSTYYGLWVKRDPLMKKKMLLTSLNEQIRRCDAEMSQLVEVVKRFSLAGEKDHDRWKWVTDSFDLQNKLRADLVKKFNVIANELYTKRAEFRTECTAESARLSRLLLPALIAVRKELNLPIGEAVLTEALENNLKREEASLKKQIEEMEKLQATQTEIPEDPGKRKT